MARLLLNAWRELSYWKILSRFFFFQPNFCFCFPQVIHKKTKKFYDSQFYFYSPRNPHFFSQIPSSWVMKMRGLVVFGFFRVFCCVPSPVPNPLSGVGVLLSALPCFFVHVVHNTVRCSFPSQAKKNSCLSQTLSSQNKNK